MLGQKAAAVFLAEKAVEARQAVLLGADVEQGSTLASLLYAGFTFIFFALEAAILGLALALACAWAWVRVRMRMRMRMRMRVFALQMALSWPLAAGRWPLALSWPLPLPLCCLIASLGVVPLVMYGITLISRL